jgi:mannosyl-3-phosphoglycerate phosphatase
VTNAILFTDLDGSLLNHDDYSFAEALPALTMIKGTGIPLIVTTSKTRREVAPLHQELGITAPFIVENGGGVFFSHGDNFDLPHSYEKDGYDVVELGMPYEKIRAAFRELKERFPARGLGDMSLGEIAHCTGLSLAGAAAAKDREFTEPFILNTERHREELGKMAADYGMKITKGGRFYHLMGSRQDKGAAARLVLDAYRRHGREISISIGIGDGENDRSLLETVNIPVLIPRPDGSYADFQLPGLIRAEAPGARGWNDAVQRILDELQTNHP